MNRAAIGTELSTHFETKWVAGDPWDLASSSFELAKYRRQADLLSDRRFGRALEIGCGNGVFSRMLAAHADHVLAIDIAPAAIRAAQQLGDAGGAVDFRVANAMDLDFRSEGQWDLVVLSETVPYIGWLYPLFDVGWFANELFAATAPGGRLLMVNTCGGVREHLLLPWLIHTYRDLFRNVGFTLEREEIFRGEKDGCEIESLVHLFEKCPPAAAARRSPPVRS